MKLKSLLLGSAAAMMTVSGANAADAVFAAEPEPMEYVKVCDTYGTGFFYLPGTETCLKFSGYVRSEFIYLDTAAGETTDWRYRGRLNIDARNETEWGTLRSQLRIQGSGRGFTRGTTRAAAGHTHGINWGDSVALIDRALISLGGLRLGYSDTFFTTHHGYGLSHSADTDGYYNYDQALFLDYTFAANGFSATVGVQDSTSGAAVATGADVYDPYIGAKYSGSWGNVAASVIYDSSASEAAWKVSADITSIENLQIHAWYSADSGGTRYVTGYLAPAVEWQWGASLAYNVNSQFTVWAGYSDADFVDAGRFSIGAWWAPVTGLSIRPEVVFGESNYTEVRLRVVRSF